MCMRGFTFIEVLVALFVFTLLMGSLSGLIIASYENYRFLWEQTLAVSEARRGIRVMAKEIREARIGEDGSYPIVKAGDKELIFFSDIDHDEQTERVRYFLGSSGSGSEIGECVSFADGGACTVSFSDFLVGEISFAEIIVSVEGDFGWSIEYAEIYADGVYLGQACEENCSDCPGNWEGTKTFDVSNMAEDGFLEVQVDANNLVNDFCDWVEPNHSVKAKVELKWEEDIAFGMGEFRRGVINPSGTPYEYPLDQEESKIISYYVRNTPPIFEYFDKEGNKIEEYPARLKDSATIRLFLKVDVQPGLSPDPFDLVTKVHLRNLERLYE